MPTVTLSGFKPDNPLRERGDVAFYVASDSLVVKHSQKIRNREDGREISLSFVEEIALLYKLCGKTLSGACGNYIHRRQTTIARLPSAYVSDGVAKGIITKCLTEDDV